MQCGLFVAFEVLILEYNCFIRVIDYMLLNYTIFMKVDYAKWHVFELQANQWYTTAYE